MDETRLRAAIDAPVEVFETTPNTTDIVRRKGFEGTPHGTFAVAESLTAAVGRTGDAWSAPSGGVWSSTLVRPDLPLEYTGRLTFAGGLAVLDAVTEFGVDARLKWPNDVVVVRDDREYKLAGVLVERVVDEIPIVGKPVEAVLDGGDLQFVVLGIGINADLIPDDITTDRHVTTMRAELGAVDSTDVAIALHRYLIQRAAQVESDDGFRTLLNEWKSRSSTLGQTVRVTRREGETVIGRAATLTEKGGLVVETDEGMVDVVEGECERLRRS